MIIEEENMIFKLYCIKRGMTGLIEGKIYYTVKINAISTIDNTLYSIYDLGCKAYILTLDENQVNEHLVTRSEYIRRKLNTLLGDEKY